MWWKRVVVLVCGLSLVSLYAAADDVDLVRVDIRRSEVKPCLMERRRGESRHNSLRFVVNCTKDGLYEPLQCWPAVGLCWCVNGSGKEILGSRMYFPMKPNCDKIALNCRSTEFGCCPDDVTPANGLHQEGCPGVDYTTCRKSRYGCCSDGRTSSRGPNFRGCPREPTKCEIQRSKVGPGVLFHPRCKPDGSFKSVQCLALRGLCWCVDGDGQELDGTRTSGRPDCSRAICADKREDCSVYARVPGFCNKMSHYMKEYCRRSCGFCNSETPVRLQLPTRVTVVHQPKNTLRPVQTNAKPIEDKASAEISLSATEEPYQSSTGYTSTEFVFSTTEIPEYRAASTDDELDNTVEEIMQPEPIIPTLSTTTTNNAPIPPPANDMVNLTKNGTDAATLSMTEKKIEEKKVKAETDNDNSIEGILSRISTAAPLTDEPTNVPSTLSTEFDDGIDWFTEEPRDKGVVIKVVNEPEQTDSKATPESKTKSKQNDRKDGGQLKMTSTSVKPTLIHTQTTDQPIVTDPQPTITKNKRIGTRPVNHTRSNTPKNLTAEKMSLKVETASYDVAKVGNTTPVSVPKIFRNDVRSPTKSPVTTSGFTTDMSSVVKKTKFPNSPTRKLMTQVQLKVTRNSSDSSNDIPEEPSPNSDLHSKILVMDPKNDSTTETFKNITSGFSQSTSREVEIPSNPNDLSYSRKAPTKMPTDGYNVWNTMTDATVTRDNPDDNTDLSINVLGNTAVKPTSPLKLETGDVTTMSHMALTTAASSTVNSIKSSTDLDTRTLPTNEKINTTQQTFAGTTKNYSQSKNPGDNTNLSTNVLADTAVKATSPVKLETAEVPTMSHMAITTAASSTVNSIESSTDLATRTLPTDEKINMTKQTLAGTTKNYSQSKNPDDNTNLSTTVLGDTAVKPTSQIRMKTAEVTTMSHMALMKTGLLTTNSSIKSSTDRDTRTLPTDETINTTQQTFAGTKNYSRSTSPERSETLLNPVKVSFVTKSPTKVLTNGSISWNTLTFADTTSTTNNPPDSMELPTNHSRDTSVIAKSPGKTTPSVMISTTASTLSATTSSSTTLSTEPKVRTRTNMGKSSTSSNRQAIEKDGTDARCKLKPSRGFCDGNIPRYHYNGDIKRCVLFSYSGCNGNFNNFKSENECMTQCHLEKLSATASLDVLGCNSVYGCCEDHITPARGPEYSGCPEYKSPCDMPVNKGPCHRFLKRWHYDKEAMKCKSFMYGGCAANKNNFASENECMAQCVTVASRTTVTPDTLGCNSIHGCCEDMVTPAKGPQYSGCPKYKNICDMPVHRGPCNASITRWHYDKETSECKSFMYGGCRANRNNFLSEVDCYVACDDLPSTSKKTDAEIIKGDLTEEKEKSIIVVYPRCSSSNYGCCSDGISIPAGPNQEGCPLYKTTCDMPKVVGTCSRQLTRYYYNRKRKQCERFLFSGCGGNMNNFKYLEECDVKCGDSTSSCRDSYKLCGIWKERGFCESSPDISGVYCKLTCGKCDVKL